MFTNSSTLLGKMRSPHVFLIPDPIRSVSWKRWSSDAHQSVFVCCKIPSPTWSNDGVQWHWNIDGCYSGTSTGVTLEHRHRNIDGCCAGTSTLEHRPLEHRRMSRWNINICVALEHRRMLRWNIDAGTSTTGTSTDVTLEHRHLCYAGTSTDV